MLKADVQYLLPLRQTLNTGWEWGPAPSACCAHPQGFPFMEAPRKPSGRQVPGLEHFVSMGLPFGEARVITWSLTYPVDFST
jgi:hypothetical protein